jgi:hypothetical protein
MIVFLIGFVGLLFILATGNMLYFKLFTDLEADRQQLAILHKLGLSERELRRIPTAQAAVMFGVPVLTAIIHGVILIPLVDAKVGRLITFQAVAVVAGIFVVLYGIYFLITRQSYISSLRDSWGDLR